MKKIPVQLLAQLLKAASVGLERMDEGVELQVRETTISLIQYAIAIHPEPAVIAWAVEDLESIEDEEEDDDHTGSPNPCCR